MARPHVDTKQRIAALLDEGLSHSEIARRLGIAKQTVSYHARTLGRPADPRFTRRYDWAEIQRYYDGGLKAPRCERCNIGSWLGEPLTLALHHVNGDNRDDRIENLALLCPNCHSQTDTFAGRNRRVARVQRRAA